jgi:Zn-dependent protease
MDAQILVKLVLVLVPMILSLSVHEWAHAWVAYRLGDPTAKEQGRLTLNPISHMDMVGTLILPALLIVSGGLFFGWAKPVPVDPRRFHPGVHPKTGMLLTAAAGPISNLILAVIMGVMLALTSSSGWATGAVAQFIGTMLFLNVILAVFNLLPVPPLDGSRVLAGLLPRKSAAAFEKLERQPYFIPIAFFLIIVYGGPIIVWPVKMIAMLILWVTGNPTELLGF